jgi:hypothetical protein
MGFVEESFAEIPEMERQEILANEKVKSLILQKSARVSQKQYGDVMIRFRTSINKKLRKRLVQAKTSLESDTGMDTFLYETLSLICVDTPFNNPNMWRVYDEEQPEDGIGALEIFTDMMREISSQTEMVKGFR